MLQVHGSGERRGLWGMRKEAEEGQGSGGERERSRDRAATRTSALRPRTARQAGEGGASGSKGQIRPRSARAAHAGKENDAATTSLNSLPASGARPRAGADGLGTAAQPRNRCTAAEQSSSRTPSVPRTTETPRPSRYASSRYKSAEQGVNLPGRSTRGASVGEGEAPAAPLPEAPAAPLANPSPYRGAGASDGGSQQGEQDASGPRGARAAPRHLASPRATASRDATRHHRDSSSRGETTAGGPALDGVAPKQREQRTTNASPPRNHCTDWTEGGAGAGARVEEDEEQVTAGAFPTGPPLSAKKRSYPHTGSACIYPTLIRRWRGGRWPWRRSWLPSRARSKRSVTPFQFS